MEVPMWRRHLRRHLIVGGLLFGLGAGPAAGADTLVADAVMRGDKEVLRALPRDRKAIDAPQPDGTTALHWAVRRDDLTAAELLIKAGADVKVTNRYGITPIGLAASNGNAAIIRALLDAGVDPNTAAADGETALMTAARTGKVDAATVFLDRGANINAKDTVHAQTALMWAVIENHTEMVQLLLARGGDVNARTNVTMPKGEFVPARAGGASGTGIIRQRALPTANGGMTPLLFAVRDGNTAMMRLLLDRGADLEPVVRQPDLAAARRAAQRAGANRHRVARAGANPNAADDYHRGALFAAVDLETSTASDIPISGTTEVIRWS